MKKIEEINIEETAIHHGTVCNHAEIKGFCPDCGNPVYVKGQELYYKSFKDIYNLGGAKVIEEAIMMLKGSGETLEKNVDKFIAKNIQHYNSIKEVYEDIDKAINTLQYGKPQYK